MAMLFHSYTPLCLWVEAFTTTMFLLNRLPSSSLHFDTQYFQLRGTHTDYKSLCVFGSKCFPYTWDTRTHKFDPKNVLCVFVGYSEKHKGYKFFHQSTRKFFISRHIVFNETVFPFIYSFVLTAISYALHIFNTWLLSSNTHLNLGTLLQMSTSPNPSPLPSIGGLQSEANSLSDTPVLNTNETEILNPASAELSFPTQLPELHTNTSSPFSPLSTNLILTSPATIPREPKNIKYALLHTGWKVAMLNEFVAYIKMKLGD
ncbi:hypothetical protein K2173_026075 [Erythroxylum novogranatense]|uniref:Retroviral polymerase SH3-like domain-containing protein n=1 Tax=Erythroxylum novogranatense TaxID=1862640 RepID=A0AAV8TW82_9ROSI|nr:hypothetical protein K2173_026075 [Erythroxylum novogranatense]